MKILLDTHIFLWWDNAPAQLSPAALTFCQNSDNTLFLSVVSVWEMQIKQQLGKLTLRLPLSQLIADQQKINGIEILPVNLAHVLALEASPLHHKDPFDRLLIAQAKADNLALLSAHAIFQQHKDNVSLIGSD